MVKFKTFFIISFFLFSSCTLEKIASTTVPLTTLELETTPVIYDSTVIQEGLIGFKRFFQHPKDSEILLDFDTGVVKANDITLLFTFISYYTKAKFYYKDKKFKPKFFYEFDETDPVYDWGKESLYKPRMGSFSNINIRGLPKRYLFEIIDPVLEVKFGSPLENTFISSNNLPVVLTYFMVNGKRFKIVFTKMTDESYVSLRSLIRYENQEILIVDENGFVYASFNTEGYKIYEQKCVSPDDLIIPIGVYSELFFLLNKY